ncbi:MAG: hypothetical protein C0190_01410 [Thermodesulfobacterium geofontis]|uniref:Lipopolysaccharide kinase n=1 Tax=Thermodesulfobacterium geofontis TaxID=1295609 RepID=A0A2N7PQ04_9BACT|nr:MAG: hypothetical protein C0190_01410 [Thermodesulfobacterium geofontis]
MKTFEFYKLENLIINKIYYQVFQKNNLLNIHSIENLKNPFYIKKKRYRLIRAFKIDNLSLFIKKYEKNLEEAESEWENLQLLWDMGFSTSIPIFFYKDSSIALIGTEEVSGKICLEIIKENSEKTQIVIEKIAEFLGNFHKKNLFHQDCYLNHFYWDDESKTLYILDVSRVIENPLFPLKYQIKDLSQLAFSFEVYLGKEAFFWWKFFWENYVKNYGLKNEKFLKVLVNIKKLLIRRRTIKKFLKGEEL